MNAILWRALNGDVPMPASLRSASPRFGPKNRRYAQVKYRHVLRQLLVFLLCSSALWAEVARIEIHARGEVLGGCAFGLAGSYEKLVGKVYFAVDPQQPHHQIIADINKAPRNARARWSFPLTYTC